MLQQKFRNQFCSAITSFTSLPYIACSTRGGVLGEDLFSKKFFAQRVESGLKIMLYNKFMSIYTYQLFTVLAYQIPSFFVSMTNKVY